MSTPMSDNSPMRAGRILLLVLLAAMPAGADDVPAPAGSAAPTGPAVTHEVQTLRAVVDERDRRYEDRFKAQEKAVEAALASAREAVEKAEAAAEKRFESVNEFRAQQKDLMSTFLPRSEFDALRSRFETMEGRASGIAGSWAFLVAAVGVVIAVVAVVVSRKPGRTSK